jgi:TolB-like protein
MVRAFRIGDWIVEPMLLRIVGSTGSTHVEPRAMDVLVALAQRAGEIVSRDALILAVWKHPHVTDEALSRCISILRHALGDDQDEPRYLETIRKRGYRLLPLVEAARGTKAEADVSIAVLPFLNLSGDTADEHLADGVTELLITNLATLPGLRVISRTSSMHYKGSHARIPQIARELHVSRVIEGSVLRSGRELQVIVQLIDPTVDAHLFTRSYTRTLGVMLRLQNEIAWRIAEEVGTTLRPERRDRLPHARTLRRGALQAGRSGGRGTRADDAAARHPPGLRHPSRRRTLR